MPRKLLARVPEERDESTNEARSLSMKILTTGAIMAAVSTLLVTFLDTAGRLDLGASPPPTGAPAITVTAIRTAGPAPAPPSASRPATPRPSVSRSATPPSSPPTPAAASVQRIEIVLIPGTPQLPSSNAPSGWWDNLPALLTGLGTLLLGLGGVATWRRLDRIDARQVKPHREDIEPPDLHRAP